MNIIEYLGDWTKVMDLDKLTIRIQNQGYSS